MVAIENAIVEDSFHGEVRLIAGRSRVRSDHEIVRRHPKLFRPAEDRYGAARSNVIRVTQPGASSRPRLRPHRDDFGVEWWRLPHDTPECSMTGRLSSTRIRLAGSARRELLSIADRTTGLDGKEAGGLLFGAADHRLMEVVQVSGPGPAAVRESHSFQADVDHDRQLIEDVLGRSGGELVEVGRWHVHPNAYRAPSPADLRSFRGMRSITGNRVELLVVPTRSGTWDIEGFVISSLQLGGGGRATCERAIIR